MENQLHEYFLNRLSSEDKKRLFTEIERDPALQAKFIELQNRYSIAGLLPAKGDVEYARKGMSALRDMKRRKSLHRTYIRVARYASAVVIAVAVVIGISRFVQAPATEYAQATAPVGERMEVMLPDGTRVWLAPCSKLTYPVKFSRKKRLVELDGEALFDVTSDPRNPFEVHSGNYSVCVLGTVFNTSCYDGSFETTLIEGSVEVYNIADPAEKIILTPNHQVYLADGRLDSRCFDASEAMYLQNGIYNFHEMTFGKIVSKLEVWYDLTITVANKSLEKELFSAKFRVGDDIETILRALQKTSGFRFSRDEGGTITIY